MDVLKPLGLAPEDVKLPLSPRSNDAYARINEEFDLLYSQLQEVNEQAGQNHAEVWTVVHALAIHVIVCPELLNQTQKHASTCLIYTLHIMLLVVRSCSPKTKNLHENMLHRNTLFAELFCSASCMHAYTWPCKCATTFFLCNTMSI